MNRNEEKGGHPPWKGEEGCQEHRRICSNTAVDVVQQHGQLNLNKASRLQKGWVKLPLTSSFNTWYHSYCFKCLLHWMHSEAEPILESLIFFLLHQQYFDLKRPSSGHTHSVQGNSWKPGWSEEHWKRGKQYKPRAAQIIWNWTCVLQQDKPAAVDVFRPQDGRRGGGVIWVPPLLKPTKVHFAILSENTWECKWCSLFFVLFFLKNSSFVSSRRTCYNVLRKWGVLYSTERDTVAYGKRMVTSCAKNRLQPGSLFPGLFLWYSFAQAKTD